MERMVSKMTERERRAKNREIAELRIALHDAELEIERLRGVVDYWVHEYNELDDDFCEYVKRHTDWEDDL